MSAEGLLEREKDADRQENLAKDATSLESQMQVTERLNEPQPGKKEQSMNQTNAQETHSKVSIRDR